MHKITIFKTRMIEQTIDFGWIDIEEFEKLYVLAVWELGSLLKDKENKMVDSFDNSIYIWIL
jgi:hypothetical protein